MKAGFEVYRAFRKDCEDVRQNIAQYGKLGKDISVLASGGAKSPLSEVSRHSGRFDSTRIVRRRRKLIQGLFRTTSSPMA